MTDHVRDIALEPFKPLWRITVKEPSLAASAVLAPTFAGATM